MTQSKPEQLDFFNAAYADIPIRDQRDTMERPFFSLVKRPRMTPIEYSVGGATVRVASGEHGIATIYDADILIWAATQITEALDRGAEASRTVRFHPHELLKGIRRQLGGDQYHKLLDAIRRLHTTTVETNIRPPGRTKRASFHWIEKWTAEESSDGKPFGMTITLAEWLYEGIVEEGGILSIHEDYFLLTGGIERWLYRVARKHDEKQEGGWQFTMRQLWQKSGSSARPADFAIDVRKIAAANDLPEYTLGISRNAKGEEIVSMVRRSVLDVADERYELPRSARRRHAGGITQSAAVFRAPADGQGRGRKRRP